MKKLISRNVIDIHSICWPWINLNQLKSFCYLHRFGKMAKTNFILKKCQLWWIVCMQVHLQNEQFVKKKFPIFSMVTSSDDSWQKEKMKNCILSQVALIDTPNDGIVKPHTTGAHQIWCACCLQYTNVKNSDVFF